MSSSLQTIFLYRKQRLSFIPWFIIPFVLFFLGHGANAGNDFSYSIFPVVFVGIIFFRIFDDMFCYRYDTSLGKQHDYLINSREPIIFFGALLGAIFLYLLMFLTGLDTSLFGMVFIIVSFSFYHLFSMNKKIVFVSLLKYPFLLLVINNATLGANYFWVLIGTAFFTLREVLEENYGIRNKIVEITLIIILLTIKYSIQGSSL
jgi:hypothetical protein